MPDFRVDDQEHSKHHTRQVGLAAMGLWTVAGSWAMEHLTDGWVPEWFVSTWRNGKRAAAPLIDHGLWQHANRDGAPGYQFTHWTAKQQPASQIRAKREQDAHRKRTLRPGRTRHTANNVRADANATPPARRSGLTDAVGVDTDQDSPPTPTGPRGGHPNAVVVDSKRSSSSSSSGHQGEGGTSSARPPANTPAAASRQCPHHAGLAPEHVPPCRACAKVRHTAEAAEQRQSLDERTRTRACRHCDADGWAYEPGTRYPKTPYQRCDHPRAPRPEPS